MSTLQDAFTIYTRKLHARTLRPFLGFRVVNPANSNCRAPLPAQAGATASLSGRPTPFLDTSFPHVEGITA